MPVVYSIASTVFPVPAPPPLADEPVADVPDVLWNEHGYGYGVDGHPREG